MVFCALGAGGQIGQIRVDWKGETTFRALQQTFPEDEEVKNAMAILHRKLMGKQEEQHAEVRSAIKPVAHVIEIIPQQ